ncbi:MAG: DUF4276 family protein [Rhodospirillales bacterium]|nr:DUF4276 family protein [Rhodospirillales bacterium]
MPKRHLEFLVEEPSMEVFLQALLPKLFPATEPIIHLHQGKPALLRRLEQRLRGYANWLPENYRIVVVVDRDCEACRELKRRLEANCRKAGLQSKSAATGGAWQVATVIAVEELEAWYFGDWPAVRAAYPKVPPNIPKRQGYRHPDAIAGGTKQAFERILQSKGYFKTGLRQREIAEAIGPHIDPARNRSPSFRFFHRTILAAGP